MTNINQESEQDIKEGLDMYEEEGRPDYLTDESETEEFDQGYLNQDGPVSHASVREMIDRKNLMLQEHSELEQLIEQELDRVGITSDEALSDIVNHEGAPAFDRGRYERTIQLLTTNTLDSTFYASKQEINDQTIAELETMMQDDPEFLAKALVYAREEGLLQLAPTLGLAVLSKAEDKSYFKKVFPRIVTTPDNLRNFVKICREGKIRQGFGGVATDAVKEWLGNLSEYQAVKYSGDAKSKRKASGAVENNFSLRDLIVMARPKPENKEMEERFRWLVRGESADSLEHNPKIKAYEQLKHAATDEERVELIEQGNLPWEVVIPSVPKMTPEIWQALMHQMPYMALLRNINNLRKYNVLDNEANVEELVSRLTNEKSLKKAKILPFRLYEAYLAYSGIRGYRSGEVENSAIDNRITNALEQAIEQSFVNLPEIDGRIAIASDVSASMRGEINQRSQTTYADIAGIFTGALLKKASGRAITLPFDTHVRNLGLSSQDRILETARKISDEAGGGTALGAPITELLDNRTPIDTFIGITDNEDWAYGESYYSSGSFLKKWREYRETVNGDAQAFLLRIDPYGAAVAPEGEPGVHFIYGWSDNVPTYIARILEGKKNQVEEVQSIEI